MIEHIARQRLPARPGKGPERWRQPDGAELFFGAVPERHGLVGHVQRNLRDQRHPAQPRVRTNEFARVGTRGGRFGHQGPIVVVLDMSAPRSKAGTSAVSKSTDSSIGVTEISATRSTTRAARTSSRSSRDGSGRVCLPAARGPAAPPGQLSRAAIGPMWRASASGTSMRETLSSPVRQPVHLLVFAAATVAGILLATALALWAYYGSAVFF